MSVMQHVEPGMSDSIQPEAGTPARKGNGVLLPFVLGAGMGLGAGLIFFGIQMAKLKTEIATLKLEAIVSHRREQALAVSASTSLEFAAFATRAINGRSEPILMAKAEELEKAHRLDQAARIREIIVRNHAIQSATTLGTDANPVSGAALHELVQTMAYEASAQAQANETAAKLDVEAHTLRAEAGSSRREAKPRKGVHEVTAANGAVVGGKWQEFSVDPKTGLATWKDVKK